MQENSSKTQESQRAYVRVIDYIKQEIRVGNLRIGSRLPSERALAEQLNVGRSAHSGDHGDNGQYPGRRPFYCRQL